MTAEEYAKLKGTPLTPDEVCNAWASGVSADKMDTFMSRVLATALKGAGESSGEEVVKSTMRLSVIDLMLFYLSVAHVERIVKAFINHESVPWWQWVFFVLALWLVKVVVDAVVEKKP